MESVVDVFINRVLYARAHAFKDRGIPSLTCFSGDFIGIQLALHGVYELETLQMVVDRIRDDARMKESFLIDVGANIGNHSVYLARYFDRVYAFEPNPRTFELLKINARIAANIHPVNVAISIAAGTVQLREQRGNNGQSAVFDAAMDAGRDDREFLYHQVESKRLDDVVPRHDKCYLIKIDVEGHEKQVLESARGIIAASRPYILFEHHVNDFTGRSSPVLQLLHEQGYSFVVAKRPFPYHGRRGLRKWTNFLAGRVLGNDMTLQEVRHDDVEPDFYEMILAYPTRQVRAPPR